MSYLPTPEKLEALGFCQYGDDWWHHSLLGAEGIAVVRFIIPLEEETILYLYQDRGHASWRRNLFFGRCPSEEFFDQLLLAIDWRKVPTREEWLDTPTQPPANTNGPLDGRPPGM